MLALLVALAAVGVFAITRLYTTAENRYVKEAFPLRTYARDLLLQMLNEETAVRGYLIVGRRNSLQPYLQGRRAVRVDLAGLDRLSRRRPEIRQDVVRLRELIRQIEVYFASQIRLADEGPAGQLLAQGNALAGQARFDQFRAVSSQLLSRSEAIVAGAERSERLTFERALALVLGIAAAAAAIGIALLLYLPGRLRALYRREQDARRSAERGDRASRALEHVDDAVVLLDAGGVVRYWNPAAVRLFDIAEEDALNHRAAEVVPGWATVEQELSRAEGHVVAPLALEPVERWVALAESRFAEGRVVVLRDVTAEQQLERARSEFLATASHELRTPLASVYGAVRTLRRPDRPVQPELDERLLRMIEEESDRLAAIVEQILVSAQLDRRELRLERETCDLRELCVSVIASTEVRASAGHTIVLDAPGPAVVECDRARLRQVLANLLDNALKYSPEGGQIEVRVRTNAWNVTIEVEDEGLGIAPDAQARVFDKFFRADAQMLSGIGGSGLGLYISRELIEQMGGTIAAASELGAGSTFTIQLPRVR
jgi:signal transduction histidine kinase